MIPPIDPMLWNRKPMASDATLRDYFAAMALSGWMARGTSYDDFKVAGYCYDLADAMLKARDAT